MRGAPVSDAQTAYRAWLADPAIDENTKNELLAIAEDPHEIEDRFFMDLQFGTAGLRGVLGAGSNRMNRYIVARATQGYADTLRKTPAAADRGIAIAYDSRRLSDAFALETALVLCGNGIRCYLSDAMRSVPQLSFAIGHYGCAGGVVITASHNPKQYNGYKVYGENGAQIGPTFAKQVTEAILAVPSFGAIKRMEKDEAIAAGLLQFIGEAWDEAYFAYTKSLAIDLDLLRASGDLPIVYTPLHGTGVHAVPRILRDLGLERVQLVAEQAVPDPDFSTVSAPNPEAKDAFDMAIALANEIGAELVLATDPDADRLGVAARDKSTGAFVVLSGNQLGCLMLHYRLQQKQKKGTLPKTPIVVRSLVSTKMADAIAAEFGAEMREVLTGFRYIGEIIAETPTTDAIGFEFGFEESYGYLSGTKIRDKDAICATMMLAETAAHYASRGMTLLDGLEALFERYGYYSDSIHNYALYGKAGMELIAAVMKTLRADPPRELAGIAVDALRDYQMRLRTTADGRASEIALPASDVLYFEMRDGSWVCVRPSGTEPKLKIYISARSDGADAAKAKSGAFNDAIRALLDPILSH